MGTTGTWTAGSGRPGGSALGLMLVYGECGPRCTLLSDRDTEELTAGSGETVEMAPIEIAKLTKEIDAREAAR